MQPLSSEPVIDLGAVAVGKSEQARMEEIQRKILAANLASQVLTGAEFLSIDSVWADLAKTIDEYLTVE